MTDHIKPVRRIVTIDDASGSVTASGLNFNATGGGDYTIAGSPTDSLVLSGAPLINVNAGFPPMDNVLVRRAVAMSIDREALSDVSLGAAKGEGTTTLPVPQSNFASDPLYANYYKYDPAHAKQLLDHVVGDAEHL